MQSVFEMALLDVFAHQFEATLNFREDGTIRFTQSLGLRHSATEFALYEGERTMHNVAIGRDQFIIIATYQFIEGKISITAFGSCRGQVVA